MLALEVLVGIAVLVGVALLATGRFDGLGDEPTDAGDIGLPTGRLLRSDDIPRLRFRAVGGMRGGLRGYRMSDVDATMEQVHEALRAAEQRSTAEGGERRVSASEPEPIRPDPSPSPERPSEPEPLHPAPPAPLQPEPTPTPEPPITQSSSLEDASSARPVEGD